jgi:hypothetical protein
VVELGRMAGRRDFGMGVPLGRVFRSAVDYVRCFVVLKRAYSRFVSDLARIGYNYIDKLDFLANYLRARIEAF